MSWTFIDAYAGIGGFHSASASLGGRCIAAIEYDDTLRKIYKESYHCVDYVKDFRKYSRETTGVTADWLFAGFPCQPFSKAGDRLGFNDRENGDHFLFLTKFLKSNNIKNVLFENVLNLLTHDENASINFILDSMRKLGYRQILLTDISPHELGLPLHRPRLFMLFSKDKEIKVFKERLLSSTQKSIFDYINSQENLEYDKDKNDLFETVFNTLRDYKSCSEIIVPKPIWLDEAMWTTDNSYLFTPPKYSNSVPYWKEKIIQKNRSFFMKNGVSRNIKTFIEEPLSRRKIEYNSKDLTLSPNQKVIQLRPSGIRISEKWYLPTIVRSSTQLPWIFQSKTNSFRQLKPEHILELNGINLKFTQENTSAVFRALGNCVNSFIVYEILKQVYEPKNK
jgi:DNA (cytosine-5)-methyltransferase 1